MGWGVRSFQSILLYSNLIFLSGSFIILDSDDVIVMVMVGKPANLSLAQSRTWDEQAGRYARKVEECRSRDENTFSGKAAHHSRGDFGTATFGVGYGGGRKVVTTLFKSYPH